jgi:hypothetical protein
MRVPQNGKQSSQRILRWLACGRLELVRGELMCRRRGRGGSCGLGRRHQNLQALHYSRLETDGLLICTQHKNVRMTREIRRHRAVSRSKETLPLNAPFWQRQSQLRAINTLNSGTRNSKRRKTSVGFTSEIESDWLFASYSRLMAVASGSGKRA